MTQVGFIVLIGLACKNAILIVEFAKIRQEHGEDAASAVSAASCNRLRPILMTRVLKNKKSEMLHATGFALYL